MTTGVRTPPHDTAAEESLLGAMLLGQAAVDVAVELLDPEDFYTPKHGVIFAAMVALAERGEPGDAVSVAAELRDRGDDGQISTADLVTLQTGAPVVSNAARYARIIVEQSRRRRMAELASELMNDALSGGKDAAELADLVKVRLEMLDVHAADEMPHGLTTIEQFLDRPAEAHAPWVIDGLIKVGWRVMMVADEGAGKTVLMRQLAMCASAGIHPLTYEEVEPVTSLIVDLENPDESIDLTCAPLAAQMADRAGARYDAQRAWLWHRPQGIDLRSRQGRGQLERVLREVNPDLVCIGPLYKMYRQVAREDEALAAVETQNVLDDMRIRHSFGLIIEAHAPHGESGKRRLRVAGTARWQAWPELGLGMDPVKDKPDHYRVSRWRGDRLPNRWPETLFRSSPLPWGGEWPDGTVTVAPEDEVERMF